MKNINQNVGIEKRKAFNFLRSYYDVLDEIHDDKDKLDYLMAILDKQFKGIEPQLVGISKLCYVGQKHSIDTSRKGWEDKVGYEPPTLTIGGSQGGYEGGIGHPTEGPTQPPSGDSVMTTEPPTEGGGVSPYLQEQEKEKEEEKVKDNRTSRENLDNRFYNQNFKEIHHIMDSFNVSKEEAIEMHKEVLNAISSVFN